jgi:hypothetical protein
MFHFLTAFRQTRNKKPAIKAGKTKSCISKAHCHGLKTVAIDKQIVAGL